MINLYCIPFGLDILFINKHTYASSLKHQPKISTNHWKFLCNNEAVLISVYTVIKLLTLELGVPKIQWIILAYCFLWVPWSSNV